MKYFVWSSLLSILNIFIFAQDAVPTTIAQTAAEEFRVKREEVFEFVQKPQLIKENNNFVISFETKAFCDVSIAIENAEGKILRHLVSGVLGPKAPAPLQKNSKLQKIIWDGKNDQGIYVKDAERDSCTIRVSLGLKPQFERTLFWSPKKRISHGYPAICAAPEGVYIAESCGIDQVRLFDHQGNYLRTVYPFPADKIAKVESLKMHKFIQDGISKPLKRGYLQGTLLTVTDDGYNSPGISGIAAMKSQVAIAGLHLNRLGADGSSAGLPFYGPQVSLPVNNRKDAMLSPHSMAFSPDGKWLYLADYSYNWPHNPPFMAWMHAVMKMPYDGSQPPTLFAGELAQGKPSKEEGKFRLPTSVACDTSGRVYVSDYMNDRIQVFDQEGKVLKIIPILKPAYINIHQKTGDIYVFSFLRSEIGYDPQPDVVPMMTHLGPFDNPVEKNKCPLPKIGEGGSYFWKAYFKYTIEFDSWAEKPTIWIMNGNTGGVSIADDGSVGNPRITQDDNCAQLYEEAEGKLILKQKFQEEVSKSVTRLNPPILWRQRLTVNPTTGKLYVLEGDCGVMKAVNQLVEITPETGAIKLINLPMGAEDLCFDINGLVYLRTDIMVVRYDPTNWKEIPFDYGIELDKHSYGMGAKESNMISGIMTPGHRSFSFWHLGGIDVSVKGHIAVTTCNGFEMETPAWHPGEAHMKYDGKPYKPGVYPGRMRWGEIHIWDKYGKTVKEDAVPGMGHLNGIGIDQDDNIYMLTSAKRIIDGKQTDPAMGNDSSGTVLKVTADKNKFYSSGGSGNISVPLPIAEQPKRSIDIQGMTTGWAEGAEWFYGGIGLSKPGSCVCWNSRFSKDYFNRSFAPEIQNFSVAVIDTNGNLILRVGKYGNVDDGKPIIEEGGPKLVKSIGGDEVSLFYACYVASHTDKRLFIADAGNTRILSVKLGYHNEEILKINEVKK